MIATLTVNPSLDRTVLVDELAVGQVQRIVDSTIEAAGKGVNIARAHGTNGRPAQAIFAAGRDAEPLYREALEPLGVACRVVERTERTRSNLSVIERDGTTTKLNEAGAALTETALDALLAFAADAEPTAMIAAAGSLPAGAPTDTYATLAGRLREPERSLAVDTSGPALAAMVRVPCAVAKPNLEELQSLFDQPINTVDAVVDAADELRNGGWSAVLISLGEQGAILVGPDGVHHGRSAVETVRNTVGAGDALLAGYLAAVGDGHPPRDALAEALAWANAAVTSPGTGAPPTTESDRRAVALHTTVERQLPVGEA
ncbi:MAG: hexose kinase [Actinomycetota bacterium]